MAGKAALLCFVFAAVVAGAARFGSHGAVVPVWLDGAFLFSTGAALALGVFSLSRRLDEFWYAAQHQLRAHRGSGRELGDRPRPR